MTVKGGGPDAAAAWMGQALPGGLVFVGADPHHALGLVDLVPGLAVAALDRPPALAPLEADGMAFWAPPHSAAVSSACGHG